jgi:hypothetical protein
MISAGWQVSSGGRMTVHTEREIPLSPGSDGMLARIIHRVVEGRAEPMEVTSVLRRVCAESRERPPELLLIRIKELWTKIAGAPRLARDEKDRRYYAFIGEALVLYFGCAPTEFVAQANGRTGSALARFPHPDEAHAPGDPGTDA